MADRGQSQKPASAKFVECASHFIWFRRLVVHLARSFQNGMAGAYNSLSVSSTRRFLAIWREFWKLRLELLNGVFVDAWINCFGINPRQFSIVVDSSGAPNV